MSASPRSIDVSLGEPLEAICLWLDTQVITVEIEHNLKEI